MERLGTWRLIVRDTAVGTAIFLVIGAFLLWPHLTPRFALTWAVVALCFSFFMALIAVLQRKARQHNDEMQRILRHTNTLRRRAFGVGGHLTCLRAGLAVRRAETDFGRWRAG